MLRITSGKLKGQQLHLPKSVQLRPSASKLRSALFDIIDQWQSIQSAVVLDLYAGSGILGLEALSRGAAAAHFVEKNARTATVLRSNLSKLLPSVQQLTFAKTTLAPTQNRCWHVSTARAKQWLEAHPTFHYHIVFVDPPYYSQELTLILPLFNQFTAQTLIVVEAAVFAVFPIPSCLEILDKKRYGNSQLWFFYKV